MGAAGRCSGRPGSTREAFRHTELLRSLKVLSCPSLSRRRNNPPICKILNKLEYKAREKAKEKAAKASKKLLKEMEFNWAIDAHDLQHRLRQLASFVEKGRRVEILLTRKKHKRAPTVEEIKQVMQGVLDTVREAGGTQIKAMEGEPGKQVKITVQKEAS
ncbi:hypothetical protein N7470_003982 [Penicillium chermesinum]|nr:hypothetical protein N7470_003982 [Penicillium chermesinum]